MKRGGRIIFHGPLGHQSCKLIEYFQVDARDTTAGSHVCHRKLHACAPACKSSLGLLPCMRK